MTCRPRPMVAKRSERSEGAREPVRQCLACRERAPRDDLIRLVVDPGGEIVVDLRGRLPGRGAWIHPTRACLELAGGKPGLLSRAFKGSVRAPDLLEAVQRAVEQALRDGLSLAAASGALVGGHDVLVHALAEGRVAEVALASDAAERTVGAITGLAGDEVPITTLPLDKESLGTQIGSGTRAAVGVLGVSASVHLRRQLQRLRRLG